MGLDNGIRVKKTLENSEIPELGKFDNGYHGDFEVTYWRKCWNIRNGIFGILKPQSEDEYFYSVTKESLNQIIKLFESYNSENFVDDGGCIWSWDDPEYPYSAQIAADIENLKKLRELMDQYNLEVYFYDSY